MFGEGASIVLMAAGEPGSGTLVLEVTSGSHTARAEASVDVLAELAPSGRGSDEGIPEPELVDERRASLPVGAERVGLAAGAVEREHQLTAEALSQRMLGDQDFELADQVLVPAEAEVAVDPVHQHRDALGLESLHVDAGRGLELEPGEGRSAPQCQSLSIQRRRPLGIRLLARVAREPLECERVDAPAISVDSDSRLDLEREFASLSMQDRETLMLVDYLGFPPSDAAAMTNTDPDAFRMRLHRARRRLRDRMGVLQA